MSRFFPISRHLLSVVNIIYILIWPVTAALSLSLSPPPPFPHLHLIYLQSPVTSFLQCQGQNFSLYQTSSSTIAPSPATTLISEANACPAKLICLWKQICKKAHENQSFYLVMVLTRSNPMRENRLERNFTHLKISFPNF